MEVIFLRQPHKFIKKAGAGLKEKIREEILKIVKDPRLGKALQGNNLKGILAHRFVFVGVHYRIAYKIVRGLIVISIASRENFYKDLRV